MDFDNQSATDVPGTVFLVDEGNALSDSRHAGGDIVLVPQPTKSQQDPLNWPLIKKYWSLALISAYACVNSFGENNWGAAYTTISNELHISITDLNGAGALNYLLLGFGNIIWIPTAMKFGRKFAYIGSLVFVGASSIWGGLFHKLSEYYVESVINGIGTSAYQALIQLTIFDMFFSHERGRMVAIYIFFQQLGSILGLILGGYISDGIGWRWNMPIVAIACGVLIVLFIFTFDDSMFPRYSFNTTLPTFNAVTPPKELEKEGEEYGVKTTEVDESTVPKRTYLQMINIFHRFEDDKTTWWQYFRRPFYLFAFPNIVLAGIQFAFGCTAGIVTFNTISEIMTEPPYNWAAGPAGLIFLAALVGNFLGMGIGAATDWLIIFLARRNNGYKEPEMRLWAYLVCFVFAAVGYFTYGWCATAGKHWMSIAVSLCLMIAQQVAQTSVATSYAMECFDGISGELVTVLAICSSCINFAISFSIQHFIDRTNYGWAFTFYGILVLLGILAGVPQMIWGKSWRRKCKGRYERFLEETRR